MKRSVTNVRTLDVCSINQTKYLSQLDKAGRANGRKSSCATPPLLFLSVWWLNRLPNEGGPRAIGDAAGTPAPTEAWTSAVIAPLSVYAPRLILSAIRAQFVRARTSISFSNVWPFYLGPVQSDDRSSLLVGLDFQFRGIRWKTFWQRVGGRGEETVQGR